MEDTKAGGDRTERILPYHPMGEDFLAVVAPLTNSPIPALVPVALEFQTTTGGYMQALAQALNQGDRLRPAFLRHNIGH